MCQEISLFFSSAILGSAHCTPRVITSGAIICPPLPSVPPSARQSPCFRHHLSWERPGSASVHWWQRVSVGASPCTRLSRCISGREPGETACFPPGSEVVMTPEKLTSFHVSTRDFGIYSMILFFLNQGFIYSWEVIFFIKFTNTQNIAGGLFYDIDLLNSYLTCL